LSESSESANKAHWESVGADYHVEWEPPAKQRLSEKELAFVARGLTAGPAARALDEGIGNGRILDHLLSVTTVTEFYGIDVAAAMVEVCHARFRDEPRVRGLALCDVSQEPVPFEGRFDFISAIRVLKYSPSWAASVTRLAGCLEAGGRLVFTMPNRNSLNRLSRDYAVPWYQASRRELEAVCDGAGLRITAVEGFSRLPYVAYRRAADGWPLKAVIGGEAALERLLGTTVGVRELFVTATLT
jgi:SAM-dependent methyltransferase